MMRKIFSKIIFRIIGWKIVDALVYPKKCLVIAAPHTSNWDFFIGKCYSYIVGIFPKYLIKSELFFPLIGDLLRLDGGIPVYRQSKNNVVNQIVQEYKKSDSFILGIAPEGTRKRVEKWKTGFYYIAEKSKIPILFLKIDYKNKEIGVFNQLFPTGNFKEDMLFIEEQFSDFQGKNPGNYNPSIF